MEITSFESYFDYVNYVVGFFCLCLRQRDPFLLCKQMEIWRKMNFFFNYYFVKILKFLVFEWGQNFRLWNYEFLCDIQLIF